MKKNFNCNSAECRACGKQYNSRTVPKFRAGANNYKTRIVIFGGKIYCETNPVTRRVFRIIIWRMTLAGFVARRSQ